MASKALGTTLVETNMAEFFEKDDEEDGTSLYEICLNVISCEFYSIDRKHLKDLPKHILQQILYRLSPLHLEMLENEDFLNLRGIETESLWKCHFIRRFKHRARGLKYFTCNSWRTEYFKQHFHVLINTIALKSKTNVGIEESSKDDLNKELFRQLCGSKFSNVSSLDMNDLLDICMKHIVTIRVSYNKTCIYLAEHANVLTKLATVIENVEIEQLRDSSVQALIHILYVLLNNKLKSFSLSNCKLENVERLRDIIKALAKSQSLDVTHCFQRKFTAVKDQSTIANDCKKCLYGACLPAERSTKIFTTLDSVLTNRENLKLGNSSFQKMKTIDDSYSSIFKCDVSDTETSLNDYFLTDKNNLNGYEEDNALSDFELDENAINVSHKYEARHGDVVETDDDLYEDIFSKNAELQDGCHEYDAATITIDSSLMHKPSGIKHELTSTQFRPHCLTELKLSSCLYDNISLQVFSEELIFFLGLQSLALFDIGLSHFPAMNDLIATIKKLVVDGSLRHLVFENQYLKSNHQEMFYNMLILSCERCKLRYSHKGLWSLRLVDNSSPHVGKLGEILRTCSYCEEEVFAHCATDGIWFKTKDSKFCSACKCLNRGVLKCWMCNSGIVSKNVDCATQEALVVSSMDSDSDVCPSNDFISKHQYITTGIENLHLSFDKMTSCHATVLASSLLRNRCLRSLSLPSCGLKTRDICNIFDGISGGDFHAVNKTIERLDLQNNFFEVNVIENNSLCNLITRSHLVYLELSYCGLEVIPDNVVLALSSNKFLKVFIVDGNRLGDAGVIQLSRVFMSGEKTSVLSILGLSANRLTSSSLLQLSNVLTTWPTKLRQISICKNPLLDFSTVRENLLKVFNVVIVEPFVDSATMYADYLSEM